MSEASKGGGAFAKVVQKTLARTKTKVLQRVGKAEKTTDEAFKDNIIDFQRQQAAALRLQKEMKHYIVCVKAMSAAAKSLCAVIASTYEEEWYDPNSFKNDLKSLELLHTNYETELAERVFTDLNTYIDQFPVYKEKMNKRNRKQLDFDNAKHAYDALYTAKKVDHTKLSKAHESLDEAKAMYEEINNELHRELPRFYEYRVEFMANNLMKLFTSEATFHTNTGKINDQLTEVLQTLATSHAEEMERLKEDAHRKAELSHNADEQTALDLSSMSAGALQSPSPINSKTNGHNDRMSTPKSKNSQRVSNDTEIRRPPPARPAVAPQSPMGESSITSPGNDANLGNPFASDDDEPETPQPTEHSTSKASADANQTDNSPETGNSGNPFEDDEEQIGGESASDSAVNADKPTAAVAEPTAAESSAAEQGAAEPDAAEPGAAEPAPPEPAAVEPVVKILDQGSMQENSSRSESKPSTSASSTTSAPVIYQVMATHPYAAEDEDELSFEAGEIINVVEFDDKEEQDDGWLMGINTKTEAKGVFPANFTQAIVAKKT